MNLIMPFIIISFALADMIAIGSSVLISFYFAKKDFKLANKIFSSCVLFILFISIIIGIFSYCFSDSLIIYLVDDVNMQNLSKEYLQIFSIFSPFIISFAIDNYLRICGKTFYSMSVNISIALINIFLDWLFIVVFNWGLFSAALATCLSISFGTILNFLPFFYKKVILKFDKPIFDFKIFNNIIHNGSPEFFANISSSIFTILVNEILLKISGNMAVGAFSIILYISTFVFALILSMCYAMQLALSYNYECKNIYRIQKIFKILFLNAFIFSFSIFLIMYFFNKKIVCIFNKDNNEEFLILSSNALIIYSFSFLLSWFGKLCA